MKDSKHIKRFNEDLSESKLKKVKAIQDDSGHWYVIPNELLSEFMDDENDEELIDSGEFDVKYGKYLTGGDLNFIQLYADI